MVTGQYGDKFSSGSHEKVRALKRVWRFPVAKSGVSCSGGGEGALLTEQLRHLFGGSREGDTVPKH